MTQSSKPRAFWRCAGGLLPREKLRAEAEEAVRLQIEQAKPLRPRTILLFGSYATGNFTQGSDIDLCVIADGMPEDELARRTLPDLQRVPKVRVIGFGPEEFLEYLKDLRFLAFDIVADGVVAYDDGLYGKIRETYEEMIRKHGITRLRHGWSASRRSLSGSKSSNVAFRA